MSPPDPHASLATHVEVPDEAELISHRFESEGDQVPVSAPEGGDLEHWLADPNHQDADEITLGVSVTDLPRWRRLLGRQGVVRDRRGQVLARARIERVDEALFVVVARVLR